MAYQRYRLTESKDGMTWSIADLFTGQPAVFGGLSMDGLDIEEAATLIDLMNAADQRKQELSIAQKRRS